MNFSKSKWLSFLYYPGAWPHLLSMLLGLVLSAYFGYLVPGLIRGLGEVYGAKEKYQDNLILLIGVLFIVYFNRVYFQIAVHKYIQGLMGYTRFVCYEKWLNAFDLKSEKNNLSEKYPQGEIISRIINDTEVVRELVTSGTFGIFIDLAFIFSYFFSFITISPKMGAFLSVSELLMVLFLLWGSKYMRDIFFRTRKSRGEVNKTLADLCAGFRDLYYSDHKNYSQKRAAPKFDIYLKDILKSNVWDAGYYSVAESLYPILLLLVVVFFPFSGIKHAAVVLVLVDLIQRSISPVKDIAGKIANIQRALSGFDRLGSFLQDFSEAPKSSHKEAAVLDFKMLDVRIEKFTYQERKDRVSFSLSEIEFKAERGQLVGILGLSGSGKTTLLNILAGNLIAQKFSIKLLNENGDVLLDYSDFKLSQIDDYRLQLGLVAQDSHVFSESLALNISMGFDQLQDISVFWSWIKTQIPYLSRWNIQLNDKINPATLSQGQVQLISAIRACYLKKPIVLFDEISSSLDSELEAALRAAIKLVQQCSITFIVAHRLETLINADSLLLFSQGKLVAQNKHNELLKSSSLYQSFIGELSQ
jgi:ABC-type multidrug transport system fused ATPase/permease subunit